MIRPLLAITVLILVATALALPPNCSEPYSDYVGRRDWIATGLISGTTESQITINNQCFSYKVGIYHNVNTISTGYGNYDFTLSNHLCYAQGISEVDVAPYGTGYNKFFNSALDNTLYVPYAGASASCIQTGAIHTVTDECAAIACCGPGTGLGCGSPLVGDPDGVGFWGNLTSLANGVKFDFNNTGKPVQMAWLRKSSGLLFLVYDWDHDGGIPRNGHDLIGTTSCPNAENGFKALALLDSNHDGWFSPADKEWNQVRLWDGYSDRTVSLESKGYQAIDLSHVRQKSETDAYGNGLYLWSHARGNLRDHSVVDVYFVLGQ
jgi:hypothetical protein